MTEKELHAAAIENRIGVLSARKKDNGRIIKKLQRQIRALRK
jgi:predicted RNA-binding protein YlqC (UPF0109 family)